MTGPRDWTDPAPFAHAVSVTAATGDGSGLDAGRTRRVVIERIQPAVDGGRFPIKRTIGEPVVVTADLIADGHDLLGGAVRYRRITPKDPSTPALPAAPDTAPWREVRMTPLGGDTWTASFTVTEMGDYEYTVEAWIDRFETWLKALGAKADAGQDVTSELLEGAELIMEMVSIGGAADAAALEGNKRLQEMAALLTARRSQAARLATARDPALRSLMASRPDRRASTVAGPPLAVTVDRVRALFGAWYEMFPRSCTSDPGRSGTFREAEARLPAIRSMGFDVVYLPPIHPIGETHRKGRNNTLTAEPGDPGSPWAIGSDAGGHTAIEPGLGSIDDFDRFVRLANRLGLEIALDIAFQTSPDHPWVREHPEWFRRRPDGSIKYAENPPKKYQDIYPLNFDTPAPQPLWDALAGVFRYWIAHGVRIFRVDNPHTKPFRFWEWLIAGIRREHPDVLFLSEAFTKPGVMQYLAKAGFTQSYTYFTWRNSAWELREYAHELFCTPQREYLRPNFFTNTPDILHAYLQTGGRAAFEVRLILAATLSASYGIYSGYELFEGTPVRPGSEEYLDSEKYEIRPRDWSQPGALTELIARVNEIRRQQPALQQNTGIAFHETDNPAFLWFSKWAPTRPTSPTRPKSPRVFVVANTDPHWMQHGWVRVPIAELGIRPRQPYVVEDLLDNTRYTWRDEWNYVKLDPGERTAHIFVFRDW